MFTFKCETDKNTFDIFKNNNKDYVFLDLEFDCFTNEDDFFEITSIGAVKCNKSFKNLNCFHYYITPISYEMYSKKMQNDFCTIKKVKFLKENTISFSQVMQKLALWLKNTNCNILTWGEQDAIVLQMNLEASSLYKEYAWIVDRIINIQPTICSSIKVLGSPVNYKISLNNMKKLFNLNREVSHNALLDSIDLMNVFDRYKNKKDINQDFLKEISYIYRNIDPISQFKNLKNSKQNKIHNNTGSRFIIKEPTKEILDKTLDILKMNNFKFTNEHPKFHTNKEDNTLLFAKTNKENSFKVFNTTQDECTFELKKDNIVINLINGANHEILTINKKEISNDILMKLEDEIKFSSLIEKDILIKNNEFEVYELLNDIFKNYTSNYTGNIKGIFLDGDNVIIKKIKNPNFKVAMYDSNIFISDKNDHYSIIFKWDCLYKKSKSEAIFTVPKTSDSKKIISKINTDKKADKLILLNKYIALDDLSKEYVIELAKIGAFKTKRKSSVFANSERLSFLYGKYVETINLEGASYLIENRKNPFIVLQNFKDKKKYELRISRNKNSSPIIKNLFKNYKKNKPKTVRVDNHNNENLKLLNKLCSLPDFIDKNTHKYSLSQNYIFFNKYSEPEYFYETLKLKDFDIHINLNDKYKPSLTFVNKINTKHTFSTGLSFKKLSTKEAYILTKDTFNSNSNVFKIKTFSVNLLNLLKGLNNQSKIHYRNEFSRLHIDDGRIKLKKFNISSNVYSINELFLEIIISKNLITFKIFNNTDLYSYSIGNKAIDNKLVESLFSDVKKAKSNSWAQVLKINKSLRNSIWRVLGESDETNIKPLSFSNHYIKAGKQKYIYEQTPLSLKQINSDKIKLKIGDKQNAITYDVSINDKNKYFIDDLIKNTFLYEKVSSTLM